MAATGYSPPTRVFEAAGCGACVVTDAWAGISTFFAEGSEILVAANAVDIATYLQMDRRRTASVGASARRRVLADHTYARRAEQFDASLVPEPAR